MASKSKKNDGRVRIVTDDGSEGDVSVETARHMIQARRARLADAKASKPADSDAGAKPEPAKTDTKK